MRHIRRIGRLWATLAVVAGLTGCANLEAVRDFTASSARLTGYKAVTNRYFASPDRVLLEVPSTPDFASVKARTQALHQDQAGQKASLLKLQDTVTGYMAALARLAGDDTFDLSPQIDQVTGQLVLAPSLGIGPKEINAYANIVKKVTSWTLAAVQAREVKNLAREHGEAMDTLLGAMQTVTAAYETQLKSERDLIRSFQEARVVAWQLPLASETDPKNKDREDIANRREAVVAWSKRSYMLLAKDEEDAVQAAHEASVGVGVVRAGHADMLKNIDHLDAKDLIARLRKASAELKDIRSNLKSL